MQKYFPMMLPIIVIAIAPIAMGKVYTKVYLADGNTPLELADPNIPFVYRDIMVGTKLTIVISSDAGGYWGGQLVITGQDRNYGFLSARDFNEATLDWAGSRFPAVSNRASVWDWQGDPEVQGFNLLGHRNAVAGDWFVIDYTAINIGTCNVKLYDDFVSLVDTVYSLTFSHVTTRDFSSDTKVNFTDFAIFALHWQQTDCIDPNSCDGTDLDTDGNIEPDDLMLFTKYWLESTR